MPGRARQIRTRSGSRRRPTARRRSTEDRCRDGGVVGVDQPRLESSAAERTDEHAADRRAVRKDRRIVLAAEDGDAFAARRDEPVGVEVHPQGAGVGRAKSEADDGDRRVGDGAQRLRGIGGVRREQRSGRGGRRGEDDAFGVERAAAVERDRPAAGAPVEPRRARHATSRPQRGGQSARQLAEPFGERDGTTEPPVPRVRNMPRKTLPWSRSSAARRGKAARTDSTAASPA